ncbi:unnamed protein product [Peniophora sp. CBMAI 1063]|nr:unnamed protein product [Peniophora sp. CBMAI 1063]
MVDLPALSALLSGWFIGPIYGANVVISIIIVRKLWSRRMTDRVSQALMLITTLFLSTCTAHAFIYLDDLIFGFTSLHTGANSHALEQKEDPAVHGYFASARFNFLACFFLYGFNAFFNNTFIVWRVYITWRRNVLLATVLSFMHVAGFGSCLSLHRMIRTDNLWDVVIRALLTSTYVLSMATQVSGALLIAWHTMNTPKVVKSDDQSNLLQAIFFALVESGSLALVVELLGIIFLWNRDWWVDWIFIAVLAQISGLSSLGIILREIYKAESELSGGFANVTSALVMQMPGYTLPRYCAHDSSNSSDDGEVQDHAVMVAIETSRVDDKEAKLRYPSPNPDRSTIV